MKKGIYEIRVTFYEDGKYSNRLTNQREVTTAMLRASCVTLSSEFNEMVQQLDSAIETEIKTNV